MKDKVALVTGAASGIGRAIALVWAREGAHVIVSDMNREGGEETVRMVRELGRQAQFEPCDVSRPEDCEALVAAAVRHFGRLDAACNNAGIGGDLAPTADHTLDAWNRTIAINLSGVFYGMKYQIAAMLKNGGGAIVNMASILGSVAMANAPAYSAAKHGVLGLTKAAALEYATQGVRVNAVGPAFIETPLISPVTGDKAAYDALVGLHPMGRLGRAEEVAELVLWLSSERASYATGAYYPLDGGYLAR